jgi:hypothetical protein
MKRGHWKLVIAVICGLWPALMIGASNFSDENKLPVRIENWQPEPAR